MLIIVVYDNVEEQNQAEEIKDTIEQELKLNVPIGIASELDVRQEDIVGYLHWNYNKEAK